MGKTSLIELQQLTKRFPVGKSYFTALKSIDLNIEAGEFTGVIGPSGSGKTTLLNIIGTLDSPSEGSANVLGHSVGHLSNRQSARLRNQHLGFIFQTYNLFPVYTVYENVEFALLLQHKSASERKKAVMVKRPEIVLADEPTANLDSENSHHILKTMKRLNEELKVTFLFATHDEKVMKYLNRMITLKDGRVVDDTLKPTTT